MIVLSEKRKREIEELIKKNYGADIKFEDILIKTSKNKLWLVSRDLKRIKLNFRFNSIGLYFGKLKRNNKIKLSIEGCQIIGPKATRNIVVLDEEEAKKFLEGLNVKPKEKIDCEVNNFVLVKFGEDFIGCGILREDYVENLLPKTRRIYLDIRKV